MSEIVIYEDGNIELPISFDAEDFWLSQADLMQLFEKDQSVISRHINKIFNDNEVDKKSNMQKMHIANSDKPVNYYSLDVVLAVGYKTNSAKAIKFRRWASKILKEYIYNGYAINGDKITNERFVSLENDVLELKEKVVSMSTLLEDTSLSPAQGIFYDGQVFDAYTFISKLIKSAKDSIILIDNYIDESVLTLFSKNQNIQVTLYTKTISKQLKLDVKKYNTQYKPIVVKKLDASHDRFLILDGVEVYHIGASLKDLGKKWFAFSRMDAQSLGILERLSP